MGASDINSSRISVGSRSHGLLDCAAVSFAWISLGCFAALTLVPRQQEWWRMTIVTNDGLMLLIGLNLTNIAGFVLAIFLMEFGDIARLCGRVSKQRSFRKT